MESPALTPTGGEFLSQLGKTWNLIQTKAKELDQTKKAQKKVEHELSQTRERYDALKTKENQAVSKIAELESATLVLTSENARLQKENKVQGEKLNDLAGDLATMENKLNKTKRELKTVARDYQDKESALDSLKNTNRELEDAVVSMKEEFDKKCKQWSKFESDVHEEHKRNNAQLKEVHIEKEELGRHLWHVMEELKSCERRVVEMQQSKQALEQEKQAATEETQKTVEDLADAKKRIEQQGEKLSALKAEVTSILSAAKEKQAETVDELAAVKKTLSMTMQSKSQLESQIETMKQDMKKVKDVAMDQMQNAKSAFQQDLQNKLDKEEEKRGEIARQLQLVSEQLKTGKSSKNALKEALEAKRLELAAARDETAAVRKECTEITSRLQRAIQEQDSVRNAMGREVNHRDKEITALRKEIAAFNDQLVQTKDKSDFVTKAMEEELVKTRAHVTELTQRNSVLEKQVESQKEEISDIKIATSEFQEEAKEKIKAAKQLADAAESNAVDEQEKSERLQTMLTSMEKRLRKAEEEKMQQIGSLTENIGAHTSQLNKRVEECNGLRNDLAMAKTQNETMVEQVEAMQKALEESEKEFENSNAQMTEALRAAEYEINSMKSQSDETANLLQELSAEVQDKKNQNKALRNKLEDVIQEKNNIKKDAASQILAFSERNKNLTNELEEMIGSKAKLMADLKKKQETVEDAVATITELRAELGNAEDDAEGTIEQLSQKLMAVEKDLHQVRSAREAEARENAKAMAQHTARLGQLQKALDESHWEVENLKRDLHEYGQVNEELKAKAIRLERDNQSLKKVETNMNGFLKNIMDGEDSSSLSGDMTTRAPPTGLTPLNLNKTRKSSNKDRNNSARSLGSGRGDKHSARSSTSAPELKIDRATYAPTPSSKSKKRPDSGSRKRPSSGSRSRPGSARRRNSEAAKEQWGEPANNGDLVLPALPAVGEDVAANVIQRTADFLKNRNRGSSKRGNGLRPASANHENIESNVDLFGSKRRSQQRLGSIAHDDKENATGRPHRAKSASGSRQRASREAASREAASREAASYDVKSIQMLKKQVRPSRKDRPNSAPMQQTPKREDQEMALQIALDVRRKNLMKIRRDGSQASCEYSNDQPAQRETKCSSTSAAGIAQTSSSVKSFTPVLQSRRKSLSSSKPSMKSTPPCSQRDESAPTFPKDDPTRRRIEYTPGSFDLKSTMNRPGRRDSEIQNRSNARTPGFQSTVSHDPYRAEEEDYDNEDFIYNDGEEGSGNFDEIDTRYVHTTEAGMPMR